MYRKEQERGGWLRLALLVCVFAVACGAFLPPARGGSVPTLAQVLESHCRARAATKSLCAQFVQRKVFEALGEEDASSGVLYYQSPDAVRWQYLAPDTSWTVLRGDQGWSVFPNIRQVQKFTLQQSRANTVLAIVGFGSCTGSLEDSFQIMLAESGKGAYVLGMTPQEPGMAAAFARVDLTLDARDYLPREVVLHETSGNTVRFEFRDLERSCRIDRALFEYVTPKGYEVVE